MSRFRSVVLLKRLDRLLLSGGEVSSVQFVVVIDSEMGYGMFYFYWHEVSKSRVRNRRLR
jgi:hypothetical protein